MVVLADFGDWVASHTNSFMNLDDENRIIREKFYKHLIFYTSPDIIKSYFIEKYPLIKYLLLCKIKLNVKNKK